MDTLQGMVNLTRYKRQLPLIPLSDLDIKDVIRLFRGVAETTQRTIWRIRLRIINSK